MSAASGITPETALAGYNRNTNTVRVDNISKSNTGEIIALFSALVGQIKNFHEIRDAVGVHLEITFFNRDAATKALCMTGYNIGGAFLTVTPVIISPPTSRTRPPVDDRRNLYVLGLPFALTKNEFAALFSRYGVVSHCVILATVDNSSRRRGFIVMSSHEEARLAMSELTRTQIKGHTIDVSWAVVQRSQGFLDGGDRVMLLDSRNVQVPRCESSSTDVPDFNLESIASALGSYAPSSEPTTTLLVTKLPAILFSQTHDLEPLFYPFGHIKKLEVLGADLNGTLSALVQYSSVSAAQEAKEVLHGQNYINYQIEVQFLWLTTPPNMGQNLCIPSADGGNAFKSPTSMTLNTSGIYRRLDSHDTPVAVGDTPMLKKRSLLATPGFPLASHARTGFRANSGVSGRNADANAPTQLAMSQHAHNFFANNHYRNLLA